MDVTSDHHVLIARLKLKLKKNWMGTATNRQKYNFGLLKDQQTIEKYKLNLADKFQLLQVLHEEEPDLNSQWQNAKQTLTSTCQEIACLKKQQQKVWDTQKHGTGARCRRKEISSKRESNKSGKTQDKKITQTPIQKKRRMLKWTNETTSTVWQRKQNKRQAAETRDSCTTPPEH